MLLTALCAFAILAAILAVTIYSRRRAAALLGDARSGDATLSDRVSFSDFYRPMSRLLDERELESARALTGISEADYARFRAARIAAFRAYLREMRCDFSRIEFKLRYLLLAGSEREAELVVTLNQLKSSFQMQILRVEFQLMLFRLGLRSVDVSPLVATLEAMEGSLLRRPAFSSVGA